MQNPLLNVEYIYVSVCTCREPGGDSLTPSLTYECNTGKGEKKGPRGRDMQESTKSDGMEQNIQRNLHTMHTIYSVIRKQYRKTEEGRVGSKKA